MDKEFLIQIENKLLEEKKRIERGLERVLDHNTQNSTASFPDYGDHDDESVSEIEDYSINLSLEQVLKNLLRDVTGALNKIKNKQYGFCKYCKKEIDQKRLLARPVSSSCIECKSKFKMG